MATLKEVRDAKLDALKEAFEAHKTNKLNRLYKQRNFMKNILEKRGVSQRIQDDVLNRLGVVAETDLDRFLTG